jgi:hypothetical protein
MDTRAMAEILIALRCSISLGLSLYPMIKKGRKYNVLDNPREYPIESRYPAEIDRQIEVNIGYLKLRKIGSRSRQVNRL